jgi:MFS family permease
MAAVAKLLFGWMAGVTGERIAYEVSIALHVVGLIGLAQLQGSYPALLAAAAVFGLGMGGIMPLMSALIARVYGPANFGPVMGLAGPILIVFQSTGAPVFGLVYDNTGSYQLGLWMMCAALAVPAVAIASLRTAPGQAA